MASVYTACAVYILLSLYWWSDDSQPSLSFTELHVLSLLICSYALLMVLMSAEMYKCVQS